MFKRILFAHNATPASERALLYVEHLARVENSEVIVLHIYEFPEDYSMTQNYEALLSALEAVAREIVEDAVNHLQTGDINARGLTASGNPARKILETAKEEDISLIVLGTRGPSNVTDFILGEVSSEVLRYASCPVFLVP